MSIFLFDIKGLGLGCLTGLTWYRGGFVRWKNKVDAACSKGDDYFSQMIRLMCGRLFAPLVPHNRDSTYID